MDASAEVHSRMKSSDSNRLVQSAVMCSKAMTAEMQTQAEVASASPEDGVEGYNVLLSHHSRTIRQYNIAHLKPHRT